MVRIGWWCRAGTGPGLKTLEQAGGEVFRRAKGPRRTAMFSSGLASVLTRITFRLDRQTLLSPRMQSWTPDASLKCAFSVDCTHQAFE
jgi:hypothetical protein